MMIQKLKLAVYSFAILGAFTLEANAQLEIRSITSGPTATLARSYPYGQSIVNGGFEVLEGGSWNFSGASVPYLGFAHGGDRSVATFYGAGTATQTLSLPDGMIGSGHKTYGGFWIYADGMPPSTFEIIITFYLGNSFAAESRQSFTAGSNAWEYKSFVMSQPSTNWYNRIEVTLSFGASSYLFFDDIALTSLPAQSAKEVAPAPIFEDALGGADVSDGDSGQSSK